MDWSQYIYLIALAIGCGAAISVRRRFIAFVMAVNFVFTALFWPYPLWVGTFDILCAVFLIASMQGIRANVIAGIFAMMAFVYPLGLQPVVAYTVIDILAYAQIIIMGGGGFGTLVKSCYRFVNRWVRRPDPVVSLYAWGWPKRHLEMPTEQDKT